MNEDGQKGLMTRRSALKLTASTSAFGLTAPGIASAINENSPKEFVGVSYDPVTHEAQTEAAALLKSNNGSLKGTLNVGGFEIPVGEASSLEMESQESPVPAYSFVKRGPQFVKDDLPLNVRFMNFGRSIAGVLTRPSPDYGKLAFTIAPTETAGSADAVRVGLIGNGEGRPDAPRKQMVKNGIPPRLEPQPTEE